MSFTLCQSASSNLNNVLDTRKLYNTEAFMARSVCRKIITALICLIMSLSTRNSTLHYTHLLAHILIKQSADACRLPAAYSITQRSQLSCHSIIPNGTFLSSRRTQRKYKIIVVCHRNGSSNIVLVALSRSEILPPWAINYGQEIMGQRR